MVNTVSAGARASMGGRGHAEEHGTCRSLGASTGAGDRGTHSDVTSSVRPSSTAFFFFFNLLFLYTVEFTNLKCTARSIFHIFNTI